MPRFLPIANPVSRFAKEAITYDDGEAPLAALEFFEDQSRSIVSGNDSPDVGFRWSVNPYRGCQHACAYCLDGDTLILMGDGRQRPLRDLRVGDEIFGTRLDGAYRRYVRARVLAHWQTRKSAYRLHLADRTELIASGDHRFLTSRGFKYVSARSADRLSTADRLVGGPPIGTSAGGGASFDREGVALEAHPRFRVQRIEALHGEREMFDITTETEDFIANGIVSHNCYARPSHEHLSLGAGTDFERKIVYKPNAPTLLRETFDKKSWRGELVVFSGVTDCYQPLESRLELTRGCLEVCAEYQNPVGIITKSPIVERDVDLLQELTRRAHARVSISVPFWDPSVARAMEPVVTTPERRMKIVETLAKAGVRVGVSVSPIVPGLNDDHLGDVLERARDAGATHAFYVLLRLPGSVREVFEGALRARLPLRAEKVLRRLREAHGGEVYDARYGLRGRGEGVYADTLRMLFTRTAARFGLRPEMQPEGASTFRRPAKHGQTAFDF